MTFAFEDIEEEDCCFCSRGLLGGSCVFFVSWASTGVGGVSNVSGPPRVALGKGGGVPGVVIIDGMLLLLWAALLFFLNMPSWEGASPFMGNFGPDPPALSLLNILLKDVEELGRSRFEDCCAVLRRDGLKASLILEPGDTPRDLLDLPDPSESIDKEEPADGWLTAISF